MYHAFASLPLGAQMPRRARRVSALDILFNQSIKSICLFKVVLVTGGGTGLGKGMSLKFSQLGAKVIL